MIQYLLCRIFYNSCKEGHFNSLLIDEENEGSVCDELEDLAIDAAPGAYDSGGGCCGGPRLIHHYYGLRVNMHGGLQARQWQ